MAAMLAALALAGCGGNSQRPLVDAPTEVSASATAPVAPTAPVSVDAKIDAPSSATIATAAVECPPQENSQSSPAALKTKVTSICFAGGKTAPDAGDKQLLRQHAALLKQNRRLVVTLVAFTNHRGSPNYNLAVTGKWLRSVADALADLGVPRPQIRKDAYPRREDRRACSGACTPEVPRVELRYRK
ncbi:MAG: OmpA family protein [Betaproteobacteria bacterium]